MRGTIPLTNYHRHHLLLSSLSSGFVLSILWRYAMRRKRRERDVDAGIVLMKMYYRYKTVD